jgi:hypothetical protein
MLIYKIFMNELQFKDELSEEKLRELLKGEPVNENDTEIYYNVDPSIFKYGSIYEYTFHISPKMRKLKKCYMHIKYKDLNVDRFESLLFSEISLTIDYKVIMKIKVMLNLLFAKILKIKIIEKNNVIIIPIVIMSIFGNKFDIESLKCNSIRISIAISHKLATIEKMIFYISEKVDEIRNKNLITIEDIFYRSNII